jgi:predicted nucleotide-binding protein (sugar kinase/HSP70/actin superfamily)
LNSAIDLEYQTKNDETTTCHFCANNCSRTFIDAFRPDGSTSRYISGFSCEKGMVESKDAMEALVKERRKIMKEFPNLVTYEGLKAFKRVAHVQAMPDAGTPVEDVKVERKFFGAIERSKFTRTFERSSEEAAKKRAQWRVGIPRVLNMYSTAPFFRTYLEVLGVRPKNIVFSDPSSEEMFAEGGKYGSVDPCYPSKVAQAHFHQLFFHKHEQSPFDAIFFPILTHVPNFVTGTVDNASCPIVAGTPDVMKAAFTKEQDYFGNRGIEYLAPAFSFSEPTLLKRAMFEVFERVLGVTEDESDFATQEGLAALERFDQDLQNKGRAILDQVEYDNKIAILVLGRPYHLDPGLHHGIPDEFQVLGYPILSMRSIPKDREWLQRFYGDEEEDVLGVNDVWPENYSANSAQKVWAAKFASRHPNVAILDLSSFKCGHDAPTYGIIDSIVAKSGVPSSSLHDIDANKPGGSIKIRVKTYAHSLKLREEHLEDVASRKVELQRRIDEKRLELLRMKQQQLAGHRRADLGLERQIHELADRVNQYRVEPAKAEEDGLASGAVSEGLVRLGRKTKDGKLVRV